MQSFPCGNRRPFESLAFSHSDPKCILGLRLRPALCPAILRRRGKSSDGFADFKFPGLLLDGFMPNLDATKNARLLVQHATAHPRPHPSHSPKARSIFGVASSTVATSARICVTVYCARRRCSARLRSVMSIIAPTNSKLPDLSSTEGWPTTLTYLTEPLGISSRCSKSKAFSLVEKPDQIEIGAEKRLSSIRVSSLEHEFYSGLNGAIVFKDSVSFF